MTQHKEHTHWGSRACRGFDQEATKGTDTKPIRKDTNQTTNDLGYIHTLGKPPGGGMSWTGGAFPGRKLIVNQCNKARGSNKSNNCNGHNGDNGGCQGSSKKQSQRQHPRGRNSGGGDDHDGPEKKTNVCAPNTARLVRAD